MSPRASVNARHRDDSGAILILVLVIVTVLAVTVMAIANLSFSSVGSARAGADRNRRTSALETATQAALENIRVGGLDCATGGTLTVNGAYPGDPAAGIDPIDVRVTCPAAAGTTFTLTALRTIDTGCSTSGTLPLVLDVTATVVAGQVSITRWQLEARCPT